MILEQLAKISIAAGLAFSLSACIDASMHVEILSETTAKGTMVLAMDKEIYEMGEGSDDDFCDDGTLTLEEDQAICTSVKEGDFATIDFTSEDEGGAAVAITSAGPGLVRVAFPTAELTSGLEGEDSSDPDMMKMMESFFEGHFVTMTVSGGEITDSNMEIAADGLSAETSIPFDKLIAGSVDLPDELYAIVRK